MSVDPKILKMLEGLEKEKQGGEVDFPLYPDTYILPGFSSKNKDWAEEVSRELGASIPGIVVYWRHWETGEKEEDWIDKEAEKILKRRDKGSFNIIAKSVGTIVASVILQSEPFHANKVVFCGIPLEDFNSGDEKYFEVLARRSAELVMIIQNENDPHGSYEKVSKFVAKINPDIKVVKKDRDDHEYPYFEDLKGFLKA